MRVLLPKGEQNKFINQILEKISIVQAARLCNLSERTIRDWRREKFLMKKDAMYKLSNATNLPLPSNFEEKSDYWYVNPYPGYTIAMKSGKFGGNSEYRKQKRYEWWQNKGKFLNIPIFKRKPIRKPGKSKKLAEFIGIMLGDGGMTTYANQICVTLNNKDDKEYIKFVSKLIEKLFSQKPSIINHKSAVAAKILVSSTSLVDYLVLRGLKTGNKIKMQVDIPDWVKDNLEFEKACMRGLMDTDGCLFWEYHKIKDKKYCYPRLSFVTASVPLRNSVVAILEKLNLHPKIRGENQRYVQIEEKEKISDYFKIVGSSNPKHLNKYYK